MGENTNNKPSDHQGQEQSPVKQDGSKLRTLGAVMGIFAGIAAVVGITLTIQSRSHQNAINSLNALHLTAFTILDSKIESTERKIDQEMKYLCDQVDVATSAAISIDQSINSLSSNLDSHLKGFSVLNRELRKEKEKIQHATDDFCAALNTFDSNANQLKIKLNHLYDIFDISIGTANENYVVWTNVIKNDLIPKIDGLIARLPNSMKTLKAELSKLRRVDWIPTMIKSIHHGSNKDEQNKKIQRLELKIKEYNELQQTIKALRNQLEEELKEKPDTSNKGKDIKD